MWNSLDLLPGNRAFWPTRPLFGVLVHKPPTWGLDDASLVRLGGVAVALSVCQPLHHLAALSRSSLTARSFAPAVCNEAAPGSIPLPPEQDTLLSQNYQLLPALKPPTQTEEAEDEEEGANADAANPNPNSSQDQRGNEQQHQPQSQGQRVSFQLNAVAAAAAKRPRMTIDQLNMG